MTVLVILPDGRALGFATAEELQASLARGAEACGSTPVKGKVAPPVEAKPAKGVEMHYTPEQCAELSGTSRSWWIRSARRGKIECSRVGRAVRFSRTQFLKALGNPSDLDPGIVYAGLDQKPLKNKARAGTRNGNVTAKVAPGSVGDTTAKAGRLAADR